MAEVPRINRLDVTVGQISVVLTRQLENALPEGFRLSKKQTRAHLESARENVEAILRQYADDLFEYLTDQMLRHDAKEEGDQLVLAVPLSRGLRQSFLKRILARWNEPYRNTPEG